MDSELRAALELAIEKGYGYPDDPHAARQAEQVLADLAPKFRFGDLRVDIDITPAGTAIRLTDSQGDLHAVLDRRAAGRLWELLGVVYGFRGDVAS